MNSQKGFVIPLITAIVVVLVIGGGLYFYNAKKVETPINNPVASSTVATSTIKNVVQCGSFDQKIVNQSNYNPTESEKETIKQSLICINQAVIKCIPASFTINNIQNVDGRTLNIKVEGNGKLGCDVSVIKYNGEKTMCPLSSNYIKGLQSKFTANNYDYSIISSLITDINVEISSRNKDNGCIVTKENLNQISDWKIYTNSVYNYQVSYIPEASVNETSGVYGISSTNIKYQAGIIKICLISDASACGNFGGLSKDEVQNITREVVIDNKNYSINGYIYKGDEYLALSLPNKIFIYLTVSDSQNVDTESKLLQILSTFKFITPLKTSCTPKWICGWTSCVNGYQAMRAVDSNNCGIPLVGFQIACPSLARECTSSGDSENSFCGGIAGIKCAFGLTCKYDGTYPDAGGKCISEIK